MAVDKLLNFSSAQSGCNCGNFADSTLTKFVRQSHVPIYSHLWNLLFNRIVSYIVDLTIFCKDGIINLNYELFNLFT